MSDEREDVVATQEAFNAGWAKGWFEGREVAPDDFSTHENDRVGAYADWLKSRHPPAHGEVVTACPQCPRCAIRGVASGLKDGDWLDGDRALMCPFGHTFIEWQRLSRPEGQP